MTEEYAIRNVMQAGSRIKHLGTGVGRTVGWGDMAFTRTQEGRFI